jgi:hypothetical protein
VVRLSDVARAMDTTGVQPYMTNGHRVAFLGAKPGGGAARGGGGGSAGAPSPPPQPGDCAWCGAAVSSGWALCSLQCKAATLRAAAGFPPPPRRADAAPAAPARPPTAPQAVPLPPRVRLARACAKMVGAAGAGSAAATPAASARSAPHAAAAAAAGSTASAAWRSGWLACGRPADARCACKGRKACRPRRSPVE